MTTAAYWPRVIGRLWVHGTIIRMTYISRDGSQKTWTGNLRALGKPARLCPWAKLLSVEDAREEAS